MNKMNLTYQNTNAGVNLTHHKNYFNAEASDFLRVQRNTADIEGLIAAIEQRETGVNRFMVMHCATLLKEAVISKLQLGNAVDLFGLGTFYITAFPSKDDPAQTKLSVNFTPSQEARDAVSNVIVTMTKEENTDPRIASLKNLYTQQEGNTLSANYSVRISGSRLRIAGDEKLAGIFFAPCDDTGTHDTTGANWIQVKENDIETNKPTELSFFLPKTVTAGRYRLLVKTAANANGSGTLKTRLRSALYDSIVTVE